MKTLVAIGAIGVLASGLFAQGSNFDGQTKNSWEEINFEFNSSILSDGYPSMLRLADLLSQHRDYRVKVTGNTDYVGSAAYNEKLAMQRAEAVKAFLVKYGAEAGQITTASEGKRVPEVDNATKEGRFINRRVTLEVRDGQGKVIGDGNIGDVLNSSALQDLLKQNADCCAQILKRLDKLDDIMAAVNALKGENDSLRSQIADLRNGENALRDQVNGLRPPLSAQQTTDIANNAANAAANHALDEAEKRNQKFSLLGLSVGPNFGGARPGNANVTARGQFFSPFGGTGTSAVQAQGEFLYNSGFSTEAQFDIGLVHRMGPVQAGAFSSFKYLSLAANPNGVASILPGPNFTNVSQAAGTRTGGALGEASVLIDYVFKGGRIGIFGTQGFKNFAVLNSVQIYQGVYNQTYARIANQYGANAMFGVWGDAYIQANASFIRGHIYGNTGGGELRLVQPITPHVAFTLEGDINETAIAAATTGGVRFGLEVGNFVKPKEFADMKSPVPMDVPRIRYEIGTRRVGTAAPIADAGPNQVGIQPQVVTLDGSGSYDPLGETLTYQWTQINGPTVSITNATSAKATFTATYGNSYGFRLTVTNTDGLKGTATTVVSTVAAPAGASIVSFIATPAFIQPGQSTTLSWIAQNVTSASINNGVGTVNATSGSVAVSPTTTTTYTLTETGSSGTVTQSVTVTVGPPTAGNPQILLWQASPMTIQPGQQSTLTWTTQGGSTVTISGLGSVAMNGSTTVSPTTTTTYTLTVTSSDGHSVSSPIIVQVIPATVPQIMAFTAVPNNIQAGQSSQVCWQVVNATTINISGIGSNLQPNACQQVTPSATTTYTLTAQNASGTTSGNVTITVGNLQILSFTANPSFSPVYAGPVTLSWTTTGATSVTLIAGGLPALSNLAVNGSYTDHPTSDQTYTLTAYGPGGQTVSAVISVFVR
ncbi:MAG TPA: OmpA family protein [Verrucomicrobiae bacterium]|nr:OmpA family protein [Verrucomicrobiae bacterium]